MYEDWYLDGCALPDLFWARRRVADDGSATVLDVDGRLGHFESAEEAHFWLQEEEYHSLVFCIAEGEVPPTTTPPVAATDAELVPLMVVRQ